MTSHQTEVHPKRYQQSQHLPLLGLPAAPVQEPESLERALACRARSCLPRRVRARVLASS